MEYFYGYQWLILKVKTIVLSRVVLRKLIDIKDRKAVEMNLFMFLNVQFYYKLIKSVHGNKY